LSALRWLMAYLTWGDTSRMVLYHPAELGRLAVHLLECRGFDWLRYRLPCGGSPGFLSKLTAFFPLRLLPVGLPVIVIAVRFNYPFRGLRDVKIESDIRHFNK
jgi:hypothetical protein